MKKMSMTISAVVLVSATFAQAQNQTNYLKNSRIQLEKDNESKLLEMLETQRLEEERARMQRFEHISFSVFTEPTQAVQTQTVQPVTIETTQTF